MAPSPIVACVGIVEDYTNSRSQRFKEAGEVILSGSLVPLIPVVAGDEMRLEIEGVGSCSCKFV